MNIYQVWLNHPESDTYDLLGVFTCLKGAQKFCDNEWTKNKGYDGFVTLEIKTISPNPS